MTTAEKKLWRMLREHFPTFHFRHQAPIRHFIVDFVSHRAKLIIEVDAVSTQPRSTLLVRQTWRKRDTG